MPVDVMGLPFELLMLSLRVDVGILSYRVMLEFSPAALSRKVCHFGSASAGPLV